MSAGKSTLLNAIIGREISLVSNEACTSKIIRYTGIPSMEQVFYERDGELNLLDNLDLEGFNNQEESEEIHLFGPISSEINKNKVIQFIDTPGINNSQNEAHREITFKILEQGDFDVILYIMNATQIGINDDYVLLDKIKHFLIKFPSKKILFVLNKIDKINSEKENLEEVMRNVERYITNATNIKNPSIIGTSGFCASIIRKEIENKKLSMKEKREYDRFNLASERDGLDFSRNHNLESLFSSPYESKENDFLKKTGIINLEKVLYEDEHYLPFVIMESKSNKEQKKSTFELAFISCSPHRQIRVLEALLGLDVLFKVHMIANKVIQAIHVKKQKKYIVRLYNESKVLMYKSELDDFDQEKLLLEHVTYIVISGNITFLKSVSSEIILTYYSFRYLKEHVTDVTSNTENVDFSFYLLDAESSESFHKGLAFMKSLKASSFSAESQQDQRSILLLDYGNKISEGRGTVKSELIKFEQGEQNSLMISSYLFFLFKKILRKISLTEMEKRTIREYFRTIEHSAKESRLKRAVMDKKLLNFSEKYLEKNQQDKLKFNDFKQLLPYVGGQTLEQIIIKIIKRLS